MNEEAGQVKLNIVQMNWEINVWWLIAQVTRISAPYELNEKANRAYYRALHNQN